MHPAFSVLFFTVTSGLGYGLLFCLFLVQLFGLADLSNSQTINISFVAAILFTLGLLSSTQHLANPKNAWRSFARFRTSWLSREGVLAVLGYPLFGLTVYSHVNELAAAIPLLVLSLLWVVALVYCTAMIYASLKTIPQWHTRWVPATFLLFALGSGLLLLGQLIGWQEDWLVPVVIFVLLLGLISKLSYYHYVGQPTVSSINSATSFSQAQVTLFDSGHSSKNFLQREFIYQVGPKTTTLARRIVILVAFVLPCVFLLIGPGHLFVPGSLIGSGLLVGSGLWLGWAAVVCVYAGLLLERWLFFVEAKHVVRHYYGE